VRVIGVASARTRLTRRRAAIGAVVAVWALAIAAALYHVVPAPLVAVATGALTIPAIVALRRRARLLERERALRQRPTENGG
jgi:hypothetical protein